MEKLITALVSDFIKPSFRRLGTACGSAILALGATQGLVDQVEVIIPALCGFAFDLIMSKANRGKS